MTNEETILNIKKLKEKFKNRLIIVAHHYQNEDITKLADFVSDSYKLSLFASESSAKYIVVCGVKFMVETIKILSKNNQIILTPTLDALCGMASMINEKTLSAVYKKLKNDNNLNIVPIIYINSYMDIKAFCGKNGGSVCTSSNAKKIVEYYLKKGYSVFFAPDYNLGKNIGNSLELKENEIIKINRNLTYDDTNIKNGKLFLWNGYCCVHKNITLKDIIIARKEHNNAKIIVHPECDEEIVKSSDSYGSTEMIYNTVKNGESGSEWVIGTESCFVNRIKNEFRDKNVYELKESYCGDMKKITIKSLYETIKSIENFENGEEKDIEKKLKYVLEIDDSLKKDAKKSLDKMIEIVSL